MKRKLLLVLAMMLAFLLCALALCACNANHSDTNHKWSEGIVVKQPTCTEDGEMAFLCTACGISKTEPISALGHTETDWIIDSQPTCTQNGSKHVECTVCQQVLNVESITATGHTPSQWYNDRTSHWHECTACNVKFDLAKHKIADEKCDVCGVAFPSTAGIAYEIVGDHAEVVGIGTATDSDIVLASTYQEKPVTTICDNAFYNCSSLTSIVIPNSVTTIGTWAFSDCSSLTSVVIPNSIISIGGYAFYNCSSFTSIEIPNSVTTIGLGAFMGCSGLESIVVEEGNAVYHSSGNCLIETASKTLVAGCKNSVIPSDGSVTTIGDAAFLFCSSLTSIVIPDSVTSIGNNAFYGCEALQYNKYGNALYLGNAENPYLALIQADGTSITSCTIHSNTKLIAGAAFEYCRNLTSIVIPNSVTTIGFYAFSGCSNLTDIYCEATSQPSGWSSVWNDYCSATVHWGYEGQN